MNATVEISGSEIEMPVKQDLKNINIRFESGGLAVISIGTGMEFENLEAE